MSRRSHHTGRPPQGLDHDLHASVSKKQRAKVLKLARRQGKSVSRFVRDWIDGLEVVK